MGDLVGKTVTTGKRNTIQNQDMMPKQDIGLPIKKYEFEGVRSGTRDTTLDPSGSGKSSKHPG